MKPSRKKNSYLRCKIQRREIMSMECINYMCHNYLKKYIIYWLLLFVNINLITKIRLYVYYLFLFIQVDSMNMTNCIIYDNFKIDI